MNRSKLKTYAPQARRDFIKAVTDRAAFYGLMKDKVEPVVEQGDVAIIAGKPFPRAVAAKRKRLEERIRRQGFEQVMEAMAYTWFNRFAAIRFMELHGYLGHGYRVLSHPEGNSTPEIVEHAEHVDLPGLDREKVVELKLEGTKEAELYRMLLVAQCNALHNAMPFLFEQLDDETELLLPENLLHSDSVIRKLVKAIPEEDWQEVEIIGWLYQFYISEKKDQVIGKVVKSEDIPAATQLFTPNWIVKYMVQNTLGRQWMATYPHSSLKEKMEFYIEPAEQTPEVQEQLKAITPDSLNPEELTLLDPACGSGHILVEAYDLLKAIYQERGYRTRDIPRLILQKNLYGLEIDDRAAQLAAFALMMKARADDRRIFANGARPHVLAIQESKGLKAKEITEALNAPILKAKLPPREMLFEEMEEERAPLFSRKRLSVKGDISEADVAMLIELFEHGKTFGSLIRVPDKLVEILRVIGERVDDVLAYGEMFGEAAARLLRPFVKQATILAGRYDAVVTNPPYMGRKGMNGRLKSFLEDHYSDIKSDLFSAFIVRNLELAWPKAQLGYMSPFVWMFISSYEKLRSFLIEQKTITSLVQLEYSGFDGATVPICTFTIENAHHPEFKGGYVRLSDFRGAANQGPKTLEAIKNNDCGWFHRASATDFKRIPGSPIAYWVSDGIRNAFGENSSFSECFFSDGLTKTGNNEKYLRFHWEVSRLEAENKNKYRICVKGGDARDYFGNTNILIAWSAEDREHYRSDYVARITPEYLWERSGISWTKISSKGPTFRWFGNGMIAETGGPAIFCKENLGDKPLWQGLGFLSSKVCWSILTSINPTLNFQTNDVLSLPISLSETEESAGLTKTAFSLARLDWNSCETSWHFETLPLLCDDSRQDTLAESYSSICLHWREMTLEMQRLEEENNRIFIGAYGMERELTPNVPLEEVTLTCNPHYRYGNVKSEEQLEALLLADTIKEFISFAIGCMMGRYSLDKPGLVYAHSGNERFWEICHEKHEKAAGDQNENNSCHSCDSWSSFPPDQDGIIPITDTAWFEDDATIRVVEFIGVGWPKEHLEENLKFVAKSLGPNRGESPRDTIRRYLVAGFYKQHLSMYKKRPIYWLFSSGKLRAFQCLVYLHRYNEGTLSRIRTEYVIPLQGKISSRINQLADDIASATSTSHRKKLEREQDKLVKQQAELQAFDEKLRHYADQRISLDLDDGVKVNYGKFGDLLAEVKAVTGKKTE